MNCSASCWMHRKSQQSVLQAIYLECVVFQIDKFILFLCLTAKAIQKRKFILAIQSRILFFLFQEKEIALLKAQIEELSKRIESPTEEVSEELQKLRTENAKLQYQKTHLERVGF